MWNDSTFSLLSTMNECGKEIFNPPRWLVLRLLIGKSLVIKRMCFSSTLSVNYFGKYSYNQRKFLKINHMRS